MMRASARRDAGFTLVEGLVGMGMFTLVVAGIYGLINLTSGQGQTSISNRTKASGWRQDARLGLEKLALRLEASIEIVSPEPGRSGPELIFRDLLNHDIRLASEETTGELTTSIRKNGQWVVEDSPEGQAGATPSLAAAVRPVRISHCERVRFTVYSPTLVQAELSLAESGREGTLVTLVHLKNSRMVGR